MENATQIMNEEIKQEMIVSKPNSLSLDGANMCSLNADTPEARAQLFNAMQNPDHRFGDYFNKEIAITDIIVEVVPMLNTETGEYRECPRVILVDVNGETYQAVSFGVYNALKRLMFIYGPPHWDDPITIVPKQIGVKDRKISTFSVK